MFDQTKTNDSQYPDEEREKESIGSSSYIAPKRNIKMCRHVFLALVS